MVFFNLPFPCNCIQMSLTAEAIQNTTTIPRRAPTNYAAYERSFCKLRFFTLQSATTQKSRLHSQAPQQPRALLRALMPSRCRPRVFDGKCALTLGAVPPQDAGMWQLRSGRTRSLHPSLRTAAPSGSALPVPLEQGCRRQHTHLASQRAGGTRDPPPLPTRLAGCSKAVTKVLP